VARQAYGVPNDDPTPQAGPPLTDDLLTVVYEELRRIATSYMANEPENATLQPTALVHEAYLKLIGGEGWNWQDEGHVRAAAAIAMRRILTDEARRRRAMKRGGGCDRLTLSDSDLRAMPSVNVVDLDDALNRLERQSPRHAELITLRFFGGLTVEQAASRLGVSVSTAEADWRTARAWLLSELGDADA
tara:strand:+ start:334 stop:900 length:567 start_codon:yes stop_codon:yes gene_type:complete